MYLKLIILAVWINVFSNTLADEATCEYNPGIMPQGVLEKGVPNVKKATDCCTLCSEYTSCSAYSYNKISESCYLWNHTSFDVTPLPNILSGVVLPTGWISTTTTLSTTTASACPTDNMDPNLKFPHPADCGKYYICLGGQNYTQSCWDEFGLLFDFNEQQCRNPDQVVCYPGSIRPDPTSPTTTQFPNITAPTTPIPVECPEFGHTNIPHSSDCSKYISCDEGYGIVYQCDGGKLFDVVTRECTSIEDAHCFTLPDVTSTTSTPTTTNVVTEAPSTSGSPPITSEATSVTSTSVTASSTTMIPSIQCPEVGLIDLPHPTDCSKYISCDDGYQLVMQCSLGQKFDSVTGRCTAPELANCFFPTAGTTIHVPSSTFATTSTTTVSIPTVTVTSTTVISTTGSTLAPDKCPDVGSINIPYPNDCSKYINCDDGYETVMQCNGGQLFDSVDAVCKTAGEAVCS